MANETKAEVRGMFAEGNPNYTTCPASTAVKLIRCEKELGSSLTTVLFLCIPVAEAREFLKSCVACRGANELGDFVSKQAESYLAKLPEEE